MATPVNLVNQSVWQITINSNRIPAKAHYFQEAVRRLVMSTNLLNFLLVRPDSEGPFERIQPNQVAALLDSVGISAAEEVGKIQQRLHAHLSINIFHYGHFRIDTDRLKDYFRRYCHYPVHIQIRHRRGDNQAVAEKRYQYKTTGRQYGFQWLSQLRNLAPPLGDGQTERRYFSDADFNGQKPKVVTSAYRPVPARSVAAASPEDRVAELEREVARLRLLLRGRDDRNS